MNWSHDYEVLLASECRALQRQVEELQQRLDQTGRENHILRQALDLPPRPIPAQQIRDRERWRDALAAALNTRDQSQRGPHWRRTPLLW